MQIPAPLNLPTRPLPNNRRDVVERGQREPSQQLKTNDRGDIGSPFRQQSNFEDLTTSQRIQPSHQGSSVLSKRFSDNNDLSLNTRKALQTFSENTPSAGQQLGVELAGFNAFA